jgi:hypothetical protein
VAALSFFPGFLIWIKVVHRDSVRMGLGHDEAGPKLVTPSRDGGIKVTGTPPVRAVPGVPVIFFQASDHRHANSGRA